ncbi:hypothetical protein ACWZHB_30410 [Nocardia sp. FBN12]
MGIRIGAQGVLGHPSRGVLGATPRGLRGHPHEIRVRADAGAARTQ